MGGPNAFDGMMHELCVGLGWCGCVKDGKPRHVSDFIPDTGPVSAEEFARWLVQADGLDPEKLDKAEMGRLRATFVRHMGTNIVDASTLRSRR